MLVALGSSLPGRPISVYQYRGGVLSAYTYRIYKHTQYDERIGRLSRCWHSLTPNRLVVVTRIEQQNSDAGWFN